MKIITLRKNFFLTLAILLCSLTGIAQSTTYSTAGTSTFTVPAGITSITVEAWGAGGRGGTRTNDGEGGGGGGGAYVSSDFAVVPGATYTVNVGTGSNSTTAGGDSWFDSASVLMAKGGNSAPNNSYSPGNGGAAWASIGTVKFKGGNGAFGDGSDNYGGGGGSSAGPTSDGTDATNFNGALPPIGGGKGGNGRNGGNDVGNPGLNPGGGGGGARRTGGSRAGGRGANGQVIISWVASPREVDITGNGVSIADNDLTPSMSDWTDFGQADINTGLVNRTFTIYNTGVTSLTVGAITFSGPNAGEFTVTTAPAATVAGGSSTTFGVTFNPTAIGLRSATISIVNNDSDENPYNFSIQGTGIVADPRMNLRGNSITIPNGDVTPNIGDLTDFGTSQVAVGSVPHVFQIENQSTATTALTVGAITISGANAADFTVTVLPASNVNINQSTNFTVTFNALGAGVRTATISIANDDANDNPYVFTVRGTGITPEIAVSGNSVVIADGDTTPVLADATDFGPTNSANGAVSVTYVIENLSSATMPLTLGAVTITGADSLDFTITTLPVSPVAVGASTTLVITFNPGTNGIKNAIVSIANDDLNENPYNFSIRGTGTNPEMNVLGNLIVIADEDTTPSVSDQTDFGSVSIDGGSTTVIYTIQNLSSGSGNLNLGSIVFTGTGASSFSVLAAPAATIANGGSTTLKVIFQPTTAGIKNAKISIANDDVNESPYNFSITGLGVRTYPDTDGDAISDNNDIDDDNDGIIDTIEQANCSTTASNVVEYLFLNETFGAGTTKGLININIPGATCTYCYEDGIAGPNTTACPSQSTWILDDGEYTVTYKITGATASDPENIHGDLAWYQGEDHTPGDVSGRMAVFNASFAPGVFYETTVSGIIPNVPITYGFWALNIMAQGTYPGSILPNITVEFLDMSDNLLSTFNTGNIGRCSGSTGSNSCVTGLWKEYSTSVNLGAVTSFKIRFKNNAPGGGGNDLALDDITIKQSYCDWEGDGVANIFDLDSDNDGIPDIEEGGFKHLSSGKGIMDLAASVWVDTNLNGLHDEIDAKIASSTYLIADTDGDLIKNFLDLDSDNDSLFDIDEAGLTNGDGDIDGDGFGDGLDTDRDGFLNLFDGYVGYGTLVRVYADDTDGNSVPDYMTIDSDNNGILDIASSLYNNLDTNTDGVIDGAIDADKDGILDTYDTNTSAFGSPRNLERKLYLDFDGRNDYAQGAQLLSGLGQATIMGWIKIPSSYSTDGTIFGQENFYIKVTPAKQFRVSANSVNLTASMVLQPDRWYHVAAVFNGADPSQKLKVYINGLQVTQGSSGVTTLNAVTSKFTIGRFATSATLFYKGSVDEVRVFGAALSTDQIQKMVYQEIKQNGSAVRGEFIPKDIELTTWSSLLGYYRLDNYKHDVIDDHITPAIDAGTVSTLARIYNVKNIRYQLAPMPFITTQASALDLAVSQNNFVNGNDVYTYDWSIVHLRHNMTLDSNLENLGLVINPGVNVILNNDNQLRNSWYLKLNGRVDLQGKSQLVQTLYSDLDPTSSGYIERDQQGTVNPYNYNYWSSPVGAMSSTTNNNNYTVSGVMKDGTDPEYISNIGWTSAFNSTGSVPITLSSYWIFKFQNVSNAYANWSSVGATGALLPGQGFTLKGSNVLSESQNYTFIGKPFNGLITSPIAADNLNLTGNPYASAIDANAFINDNLTSTTGTLYFWEHYSTNETHILAQYQGGYATRNLVGGTPPVAPAEVSGIGASSRTPGRYVPVGQGFFLTGSATGGIITFNNGQRTFIKEDNALSNIMFKSTAAQTPVGGNNEEDEVETDNHALIRIGFNSANNYHRQILLGFMDDLATSGIDPGYDAIHLDSQPNDMCFINNDVLLNIQGEGYFNATNVYPLQVKTASAGEISIGLDGTENFDADQEIYIYDSVTNIYHNLRTGLLEINLPAGTLDDRFSLTFMDSALDVDDHDLLQDIEVAYTQNDEMLNIRNNKLDVTATSVTLYNILGQRLAQVDIENEDQKNIMIPVKNYAQGTYIVQIKTTGGDISEKIIIK